MMSREALIAAAARLDATIVRAPGVIIIVLPDATSRPDELVPLDAVAQLAKTSVRVIKDAIRSGALVGYGKQRNRSARRSDVDAWIESRRYQPVMGPDDADVDRWMQEKQAAFDADIKRRMRNIAARDRRRARSIPRK